MILYHGSSVAIENPIIINSEQGRDFGIGFYTTSIWEQAKKWAVRKAKIAQLKNPNAKPIVSVYYFNDLNLENFSVKKFQNADIDWLNFVCKCRSDITYKPAYDLVIGKIANDNVGETVSFVIRGIMRKEDALERLKFEKINDQFCFCNLKILSLLKYKEFEIVK